MSKLVWDVSGERFYETGVSHGVLYPKTSAGAYTPGVVWNGLTSVTESPSGADETVLWADDIKYAAFRAAEDFGATIEAYTYPDEFAACDGTMAVSSGVYLGQQTRQAFGLSFQTKIGNDASNEVDNVGYKIHLIWNATASPSERQYQTINYSPDAIQFSWELTTTPVAVGKVTISGSEVQPKPTAHMVIDASKFTTEAQKGYLAALEDALYGTTNDAAYLPTPDQVISLITTGALPTP